MEQPREPIFYPDEISVSTKGIRLKLSEEVLSVIEHQADKGENVNLMLLVQILKELRELRGLLEIHQKTSNCSNDCSRSTDNSENKHG